MCPVDIWVYILRTKGFSSEEEKRICLTYRLTATMSPTHYVDIALICFPRLHCGKIPNCRLD